jgi:hypothetical protein
MVITWALCSTKQQYKTLQDSETKCPILCLKRQATLLSYQPKDGQETGCRPVALLDPVTLASNRTQHVQPSTTLTRNVDQVSALLIPQGNWNAWLEGNVISGRARLTWLYRPRTDNHTLSVL